MTNFHLDSRLGLIFVCFCRPTSVLSGHKAGIIDIKIHEQRRQILTYSKANGGKTLTPDDTFRVSKAGKCPLSVF